MVTHRQSLVNNKFLVIGNKDPWLICTNKTLTTQIRLFKHTLVKKTILSTILVSEKWGNIGKRCFI